MRTAIYKVQGDDGSVMELEGPLNASPDEIEAFAAQEWGRRQQMQVRPERPPVDQSTANLDPRDVQARRRPMPATDLPGKLREVWQIGGAGSAQRGFRDVLEGVAQLGSRAGNLAGLVPDETVRNIDRSVQQSNRDFEWATGRKPGDLDLARLGGSTIATLPLMAGRLARGATMGERAAGAAVAGGLTGAVQPIAELDPGESYAGQKTGQVALGVAAGGLGTPVLEKLAGVAVPAINRVVAFVGNNVTRITSQKQVDNLIAQELEQAGIQWRTLPDQVRAALRQDVTQALDMGGIEDPAALRRLIDIRSVGATPTRGSVTLDPVQITAEKNAAKIGAASNDLTLQQLPMLENRNNAALIGRLNQFGPGEEGLAGARVGRALGEEWENQSAKVTALYNRARAMNGGEIPLSTGGRATQVIEELETTGKLPSLPPVGASILNTINEGVPITIGRAEGMKTSLAAEIRKAQAANDGNAEFALRRVYSVLEDAEPAVPLGDEVMAAFRAARDANRNRMGLLEKSPVLREVYSEKFNPEQFFRKHVLSPAVQARDLQELRKLTTARPEVLDAIRGEIVTHLKKAALNRASDEVGTFSQSAYNKALQAIGVKKLQVFFGPEEVAKLQQLGRAASYLQVQPKGSAVANSNSPAGIFQVLDRLGSGVPVLGSMVRGYGKRLAEDEVREQARNALLRPLPSSGLVDESVRNALTRAAGPASIAIGMGLAQ